jgi:glycine betaine/choline ABC-type transport system substrate-binding protein
VAAASATAAAAAPIKSNPANAKRTVVVGSKNFPEQLVLGEIYAQTLRAAGYKVRKRLGLKDERTAFRALKRGTIGVYPEYTGIVLSSFYGYPLAKLPRSAAASYRAARRRLAKDGVVALQRTDVNDTFTLGMTRARAEELGRPRTISGLSGKASKLTIAGPPGCKSQPVCLKGVRSKYHLHFKRFRTTSSPYTTLDRRSADVAFVFTTDPELATNGYVALRDNRHLFPSFHVTLLAKRRVLDRLGPDAAKAVKHVQKPLTTARMRELNARVAFDRKTPRQVATEYLREAGFVK